MEEHDAWNATTDETQALLEGVTETDAISMKPQPPPFLVDDSFCPFPPAESADADGLLMLGGRLTPEWLVAAYRRGIFPWPFETAAGHVLAWFSPDPRAVLELTELHVPRRLERRIRRGEFSFTMDRAFSQVIRSCAAPRKDSDGTWIIRPMIEAYTRLYGLGIAHSVEVWQDEKLVGGLYGVALGGYFAAESMFHHVYDASKAAIVFLARHLARVQFSLLDVQQWSPHLAQLGARELPRQDFLQRVAEAAKRDDVSL